MSSITKTIILGLTGATMLATAANAGGYSRGSVNLDPLLSSERFELSTSVAVTMPTRSYSSVNGVSAAALQSSPGVIGAAAFLGTSASEVSRDYATTYATFTGTAAVGLHENFRCAASYSQPYGANADYGYAQLLTGVGSTTTSQLSSHEYAGTCAGNLSVGSGKLHVIGGVFYQDIAYNEDRGFGFGSPLNGGDVELGDGSFGYRVGVAYTIPEIALKASLIYRSEVSHDLTGTVRNPRTTAAGIDGFAAAKTPQSVKLAVQSGVAPGWLVFGSVEWTDWSVLQQINVFADAGLTVPLGLSVDAFFRDGWTVSGGVGHQLTEKLAVQSSLTWDRGTSAVFGGDEVSGFTDTWTIAAGGRYSLTEKASVSAGLAYSILTAGEYTNLSGDVIGLDQDNAISGGLSFNVKF